MGQKEGMERAQVIACTTVEPAFSTISDALALDPCLTPVCRALLHTGFPPSNAYFPIRRLSLAKPAESSRNHHATRHPRRRTAERSFPMRDTREMGARMVVSASLFEQETGWS